MRMDALLWPARLGHDLSVAGAKGSLPVSSAVQTFSLNMLVPIPVKKKRICSERLGEALSLHTGG